MIEMRQVLLHEHWICEVRFDDDFDDFHDCTCGTCPEGHRKMIDD